MGKLSKTLAQSLVVLCVFAVCLPLTVPAVAGESIFTRKRTVSDVSGKYRKNNVIRAQIQFSVKTRQTVQDAFQLTMLKIARMAKVKGFDRIGMTKQECGSISMSGGGQVPLAHKCRILAQMVGDDEKAEPEGKRPVIYYRVNSILLGVIIPEDKDPLFKRPTDADDRIERDIGRTPSEPL